MEQKHIKSIWLGINDLKNEDEFITANGNKLEYNNWSPGEPNNSDGQDDFDQDVVRLNYDGTWRDTFVYHTYPFICTIEPQNFSVQSKFIIKFIKSMISQTEAVIFVLRNYWIVCIG